MDTVNRNYLDRFKREDTSFKENDSFLELFLHPLGRRYSKTQLRGYYETGLDIGFEQGININSLPYQTLQLKQNCKNENHLEFYNKFLKLADEYNVAITYHPEHGMTFVELNK